MNATATANLTPGDIQMFQKFRVPADLLEEAGIRRVTNREARDEHGFRFSGDLDGILFPYFTPTGERVNARIRRDYPDVESGKPKNKYVSAAYDHRRFYYPPDCGGWIAETSIPVVIVEAEKSVLAVTALSRRTGRALFPVGTGGAWGWKGRIGKVVASDGARVDEKGPLPDFDHFTWTNRQVIVCLDGNVETNNQVHDAESALVRELQKRGADVRCARLAQEPGVNGPDDFIARHADEEFLHLLDNAANSGIPRLRVVTAAEFLTMQFPPRESVLDPIFHTQSTNMMFSKRGVGKTYLSLGMACAVAAGAKFLRWEAKTARRVLYVDGEMPGVVLQQRLALIIAAMDQQDQEWDPDHLRLIAADIQDRGIPSLATDIGQQLIEDYLNLYKSEFLIIDNISTLCHVGKENEAESWLPIQEWLLKLRRQGVASLLDHHAGKNGAQRGTSKREDVLDTIIALRHPENYNVTEGLRCEIHFEKARGVRGDAVQPFEVQLQSDGPSAVWLMKDLDDVIAARAAELSDSGLSIREVAKELGIHRSKVERMKKKYGGKA